MPNSLMNEEELQQWILRRLGGSFWKIELSIDELTDAVEAARRWFSAKKGVRKNLMLPFWAGVTEYALDDQIDTVLDVSFPVNPMDISMVFSPYILQDEKVPYDVFAAPSSIGIYSSYTQTVQYVEMAKRILSAEPDWRQEGRTLHLFPVPRFNGQVRLDYKSHDFTIEQLTERDHDLVKRYALAFAKRDVANVRVKYNGEFPGAQGATTANFAQLFADAEKEMEALEKEIFASAMPMHFLAG